MQSTTMDRDEIISDGIYRTKKRIEALQEEYENIPKQVDALMDRSSDIENELKQEKQFLEALENPPVEIADPSK